MNSPPKNSAQKDFPRLLFSKFINVHENLDAIVTTFPLTSWIFESYGSHKPREVQIFLQKLQINKPKLKWKIPSLMPSSSSPELNTAMQ